jgi:hypothetical protein
MKIAICYRGYLRTIDQTFDSHKKFFSLDDHEVDYFIHTWDGDDNQKNQIEFAKKNINPKRILIEEPKEFQKNSYHTIFFDRNHIVDLNKNRKGRFIGEGGNCPSDYHTSRPYQLLSYLYSGFICDTIFSEYCYKNNQKYDLVISMRSDLYFDTILDYSLLDPNKINSTRWNVSSALLPGGPSKYYYTDMIAISSKENISKYSETFLHIPRYYYADGVEFIPEVMVGYNLYSQGVGTNYMYDITHKVIRREDHDQLYQNGLIGEY